jgi:putative endonuclease
MTNKPRGTLYTGYTQDLATRLEQHHISQTDSFVRRYNLDKLVHYEVFDDMMKARTREARVKRWRRDWKIALVEERNPTWQDLTPAMAA